MTLRIIPRLDIKGPNLVKGIHLEGLRVLGKPETFARMYYASGADELLYIDAVASLYGRNNLLETIERTSSELFIPLCVGGGLRSVNDVRDVLRAGADKVAINTAAVENPELIRETANVFGSSTIVVSIHAKKRPDGSFEALTDYGRENTGMDAFEWALRATELGAGELLITSIDREGTGKGFECDFVRRVSEAVPVPVIACGGAGSPDHILEVVQKGKADAVSMASILHYTAVMQPECREGNYEEEGNTEFLQRNRKFNLFPKSTIPEIKHFLAGHGVACRT